MNIFKIIFIILSVQFISCQTVYKNSKSNNIIFLGEYNDNEELKVFYKDSIQFIKSDSLKLINQYSTKEFIQVLDSLNLSFVGEGSEPYWEIRVNGKEAIFQSFTLPDDKKYQFTIETYIDEQSGTRFMFKSIDNNLFGIISKVDNKNIKEQACSLSSTDNYYIYEIFVTVNKKMYKGCVMIDK